MYDFEEHTGYFSLSDRKGENNVPLCYRTWPRKLWFTFPRNNNVLTILWTTIVRGQSRISHSMLLYLHITSLYCMHIHTIVFFICSICPDPRNVLLVIISRWKGVAKMYKNCVWDMVWAQFCTKVYNIIIVGKVSIIHVLRFFNPD